MYKILLVDPSGREEPEVIYQCRDRRVAQRGVDEWNEDPEDGIVAVLWPPWAPLPVSKMIPAAACDGVNRAFPTVT